MNTPTRRIVVLDDHSLFAESLAIALSSEGFHASTLTLRHRSPLHLVTEVAAAGATLALVDLDLGSLGTGLDLIKPLVAAKVAVVVVTGSLDRAEWGHCIANGARAVLSKGSGLGCILATIRRFAGGLPLMTPADRAELLTCWEQEAGERRAVRSRLAMLTRREADVLGMLMSGLQVGDIARTRVVAESTVRTQVKSILAKLQVGSQLTAVGLAHRVGWRPPVQEYAEHPRMPVLRAESPRSRMPAVS